MVLAFIQQFSTKKEAKDQVDMFEAVQAELVARKAALKLHEHDWRSVTEFVQQCRVEGCGIVEFKGDVPEGVKEYVRLMAEKTEDPIRQARAYVLTDPKMWGIKCPACSRPIPLDLKAEEDFGDGGRVHCPYCWYGWTVKEWQDFLSYEFSRLRNEKENVSNHRERERADSGNQNHSGPEIQSAKD
jgi:DNA-directed RNA polymerase subunit RPC12/RpoP